MSRMVRIMLTSLSSASGVCATAGSSSGCTGAVLPYPGWIAAMEFAIAVTAPSRRNPGWGLAPWLIASPAFRPLGVAPTFLPKKAVCDQENHPGMKFSPG